MTKQNYITRIEGHGCLKIDQKKAQAEVLVEEEERLFEQLVINHPYQRAPFITARICGICPTAHYLASIKALENAFDITPTDSAIKLREALLAAQIAQSHTLHLFFLVLPDYLNTNSVKQMGQRYPAEFHLGLNLKKTADKIVKTIGGREVHPLKPQVGGPTEKPNWGRLKGLTSDIKEVLDEATDTVKLFAKIDHPDLQQDKRAYLSLKDSDYPLYRGDKVSGANKEEFEAKNYKKHIIESEREGTLVKFSQYVKNKRSKLIMVGALARLNKSQDKLCKQAKKLLKNSRLNLPAGNPFDNITAQAIEINHYLKKAQDIINSLKETDLDNLNVRFEPKKGKGVGAVEAPRGTLYHYYQTDKKGHIIKADIITPTASSLLSLEEDADRLVKLNKNQRLSQLNNLSEQLIRAYDPCLTCSVH